MLSHPQAREAYKKRLRYIVARWGYSPHIAAWQLWNEIDHGAQVLSAVRDGDITVEQWHEEMSAYLQQIDVHRL